MSDVYKLLVQMVLKSRVVSKITIYNIHRFLKPNLKIQNYSTKNFKFD